jgi:3-isopropylmalate dehydrogenase
LCRYGLNEPSVAERLEKAVNSALDEGYRTGDIMGEGCKQVTCTQMGEVLAKSVMS